MHSVSGSANPFVWNKITWNMAKDGLEKMWKGTVVTYFIIPQKVLFGINKNQNIQVSDLKMAA
jgi:hypothetical protein